MDHLLKERLATITGHLVQFPTVGNNEEDITHCVNWVRTHILTRASRLHARQFQSGGKPSILFTAGDGPPRVLLCGHLDVVEAQDHLRDYTATQIDDRHLGGRGTADMKGPIAALIDIMETDAQSGLGLLLTTDEESGGEHGVGSVVQKLEAMPDVVILPDGGANMRLVTEQKGILRLKIVSEGVAAHGARPWLGVNSVVQLMRGYEGLLRAYPLPKSEDDWRTSITLSQIHGGITPNTVPWYAEAILDIRYPGSLITAESLYLDIKRRLARFHVQTHRLSQCDPYTLDMASPFVAQLQKIASSFPFSALAPSRESGASDARYFGNAGVPVLMFQPECAGWHSANERINLDSLADYRTLCTAFVRSLLQRSGGLSRKKKGPAPTNPIAVGTVQRAAAE